MEDPEREKRAEAAGKLVKLAAELGNVSAACRRLGLDRSVYYRIKKVTPEGGGGAPEAGSAGLRKFLDGESVARILRLCLEFPDWGCDRIAYYLVLKGHPVSSPSVQKILIRKGLGRVAERMAEAERRKRGEGAPDSNQVSP